MILCTGGMSVDPDDRTPAAIAAAGVNVVSYGAPVLPGAMFLVSYFADGTPVLGLPGCVMYAKATIFDLLLPRIGGRPNVWARAPCAWAAASATIPPVPAARATEITQKRRRDHAVPTESF